jgi:hypothetical protein
VQLKAPHDVQVVLYEELDDTSFDDTIEYQKNGGDLHILQISNFSPYAALKGIKVTKEILGGKGRVPAEIENLNIVEYIFTLKAASGSRESIFARAMKGRIASSMNFLINPNMDQEASDISDHIVEVFQRATGPNNNLIKASILIPGDENGSVLSPSLPADEQNDQQVEFEYTEPQHDLVTWLSKLEEKFQAFERMDKKLTLIGGSVDTLNSSISNLTSSGPKSDTATTEESTIDHTLVEDILHFEVDYPTD